MANPTQIRTAAHKFEHLGRTPAARLARTASALKDHGFDVEIDRENEQEFWFHPSDQGVQRDTALFVARQIVSENDVEMTVEGDTATVHVPRSR